MIAEFLEFALQLARSSGEIAREQFGHSRPALKADGTEVTDADRAIERVMRTAISQRYPSHGILGEEFGEGGARNARRQWVLDPIDGTAWYLMGVPMFGTLVAMLEDMQPVVGVIHLPLARETLSAGKGLGCWFEEGGTPPRRVSVRQPVPLRKAVVTASGIQKTDMFPREGEHAHNLRAAIRASGKFKFYGDCVQHVLVCRGLTHAAIDTVMGPWDSAAVIPCILEAGGTASTVSGDQEGVVFGGNLVTSCGQPLHQELLFELQRPAWDDSGWDTSRLLKRKTG